MDPICGSRFPPWVTFYISSGCTPPTYMHMYICAYAPRSHAASTMTRSFRDSGFIPLFSFFVFLTTKYSKNLHSSFSSRWENPKSRKSLDTRIPPHFAFINKVESETWTLVGTKTSMGFPDHETDPGTWFIHEICMRSIWNLNAVERAYEKVAGGGGKNVFSTLRPRRSTNFIITCFIVM